MTVVLLVIIRCKSYIVMSYYEKIIGKDKLREQPEALALLCLSGHLYLVIVYNYNWLLFIYLFLIYILYN